MKNLREKNVYKFYPNESYRNGRFEWKHCFDAQLIAYKGLDRWYFFDTYFGLRKSSGSELFTLYDIRKFGKIKFICNLNDIIEIEEHEKKYYNSKDIFDLSHQHGSYKFYAIKKGIKKNRKAMIEYCKYNIDEEYHNIENAISNIDRYVQYLDKLKSGISLDDFYI